MTPQPFPHETATRAPGMPQRRGRWLGRLLVTTVRQAAGAPLIDGCSTIADGGSHGGYAIRRPGQRNAPSTAVVLAWKDAMVPWSLATRMRVWRYRTQRRMVWPLVARLLRLVNRHEAPACEGCGIPITGQPFYGGEDAPELCRWCSPLGAEGSSLHVAG